MSLSNYKKLTANNWLTPDRGQSTFAHVSPIDGSIIEIEHREWAREILKVELEEYVPDEVRQMFEVARGTLAYGFFFYPLYSLSEEQFFKVVDWAVKLKCQRMDAPDDVDTYDGRVDWLVSSGVIPEKDRKEWLEKYQSAP